MQRSRSTTEQRRALAADRNEASLERNKLYVAIPDRRAEADGLIRVIDEDAEDYLYPMDWFVAVAVPKVVEQSLLKAS